jgi:hypothetical protein
MICDFCQYRYGLVVWREQHKANLCNTCNDYYDKEGE